MYATRSVDQKFNGRRDLTLETLYTYTRFQVSNLIDGLLDIFKLGRSAVVRSDRPRRRVGPAANLCLFAGSTTRRNERVPSVDVERATPCLRTNFTRFNGWQTTAVTGCLKIADLVDNVLKYVMHTLCIRVCIWKCAMLIPSSYMNVMSGYTEQSWWPIAGRNLTSDYGELWEKSYFLVEAQQLLLDILSLLSMGECLFVVLSSTTCYFYSKKAPRKECRTYH